MPKTLGPYHMAQNQQYEPQRTNHFEVQITDVGGDALTLAVSSTNLPTISVPATEVPHGNATIKVAGQVEFDDVSIEVKDFIGADVEGIIDSWQREVYDPVTDQIGLAVNYKRTGYLYQYAPDGSNIRTWTLDGVWPNSVEYGDMGYDGSDVKQISMTLSVDKARNTGGGYR